MNMDITSVGEDDALALLGRQESQFWDFKSASGNGSTFQKIACALANSDGGEFAVGIEDEKHSDGLDRWQGFPSIEASTVLIEALSRDCDPPVPYVLEYVQLEGNPSAGLVCQVLIHKSSDVHRCSDGKTYARRGASTVQIKDKAITDLMLSKGTRSYEDQALKDYGADDLLLEEELLHFLGEYSPSTTPERYIFAQRLADRSTRECRIAAALLYAEAPPAVVPKRCAIKVARYNTRDAEPQRKHLEGTPTAIEGPARLAIEAALEEVQRLLKGAKYLRANGELESVRYPVESLKEVIVNAVLHRDYNISDDILIRIFDDRVEVRSPGLLPGYMTLDNLLTERFSRNPTLVRLLNKYPNPLNKDIGEGLNTAFEKMKEARLQAPRFTIEGNAFVVVLPHAPLARPEEIVLEYVSANGEITNAIARELTGISSENSMKDVFLKLKKTGRLEMIPERKGNKAAWRLISQPLTAPAPASEVVADPSENASATPGNPVAEVVDEDQAATTSTAAAAPHKQRTNKPQPIRAHPVPGRNEPCYCGSGQKYKRCHLPADAAARATSGDSGSE